MPFDVTGPGGAPPAGGVLARFGTMGPVARWTAQQIAQLAADDKSVVAARKLARPGPWSDTGCTDALIWGRCQGSGSTPYQVTVDLTGPTFTCSCPSRKFPCKHGLALLMLWVEGDGAVADVAEPSDFARDWAGGRPPHAPGARRRDPDKPVDPVAQAKRREERVALMSAGLDDFARWLADLVRQGLAAARSQPYSFWDAAAGRLVDAQVTGMAERVREMGSVVAAGDDWADVLLEEAARWWLAVRAWRRRDELGPADMGNLRAFLGWPYAGDEIRAGEHLVDRWEVVGVHRTDDGRLQQQRTWLHGATTGELVIVLDFAVVGGVLNVAKVVGSVVEGAIACYPGTSPRRALFVDDPEASASTGALPAPTTVDDGLARIASWMAGNPWIDRFPLTIASARLAPSDEPNEGRSWIVDERGDALALAERGVDWSLLALTGDRPTDIFGEVDHGRFRPLTVVADGQLVST